MSSWPVGATAAVNQQAGSTSTIDQTTFDLSVKNPNAPEEAPLRSPKEILDEIAGAGLGHGIVLIINFLM